LFKNTKNKISNLDNLALDVYENKEFVKSYASKIEYNSHNALYERPATLSLLPDLAGKKVLDAGCGPGVYSSILIDRGADVTAIDFSDEMIRLTKEKTENNARVIKANLNHPLDFLKDEEFDLIVSSLVIHYIKDLQNLFSEFNRVLKTGGLLVFSTAHPFLDQKNFPDTNYFETELITETWAANIEVTSYKRPLNEFFNLLKETDFKFDELLEPVPVIECKEKYPETYDVLLKNPWFICFRAIKEK